MADHQPHTCNYCDKFLIDTSDPRGSFTVAPDVTADEAREGARNGCELFRVIEPELANSYGLALGYILMVVRYGWQFNYQPHKFPDSGADLAIAWSRVASFVEQYWAVHSEPGKTIVHMAHPPGRNTAI